MSKKKNIAVDADMNDTNTNVTDIVEDTEKKAKKKHKNKQVMTVEELLQKKDEIEYEDEFHRKIKIKVKGKASKLRKREARMGYFFIAPWVIGAIVFLLVPLGLSLAMAFSRVSINGFRFTFVNIENFKYIFSKEPDLKTQLLSYLFSSLFSVPLIVVFALIMAMLLNTNIRGRAIFRAIFFLPVIIVSGPVMSRITDESSRVSTVDIEFVHFWLLNMFPPMVADPIYNVFTGIMMILWYSGVQLLIFLAAIQKIDKSLYEAAKIDGGSSWECFWKITLPTIKPMILLNAVYTVIAVSQKSDNWFIGRVTNKYIGQLSEYGKASAMAWMYSVIVLILVGLVVLLFKQRRDPYEKQVKKTKRLEKRTRRQINKSHKRALKNEQKFLKHVEKQRQLKEKGKLVEGGLGE